MEEKKLQLKELEESFSICKVESEEQLNFTSNYTFIGKTEEEISMVCETIEVPEKVIERDDGWKGFRIQGVLDFSLIGILAKISNILANNKIGIFVVSTYNTDYIFVKKENFKKTVEVLSKEGYKFV